MPNNDEILEFAKKYYTPEKFILGENVISIADAQIGLDEIVSLISASLSLRIVDGEISHKFELDVARFIGSRYSTFCNSGSSANLLAISALTSPKLKSKALMPGDEVITCAAGFPTTIAPILQNGCVPVFIDTSIGTYNPSPYMIEDAITEKTKAIFLAHTLGNPLDIDAIKDIADRNELWLIEDVCDALGGEFSGRKLGTFGHIATTSFYPAHLMTTGEGGMVFTDNGLLHTIIRSFRDWGRDCWCLPNHDNTCGKRFAQKNQGDLPDGFDHKYIYSHVGYNLKSSDLHASVGIEQIKKLPSFLEKRRYNWNYLHKNLSRKSIEKVLILPSYLKNSNPAWFGFVITVKPDAPFTRNELTQYLNSNKIATRNLFAGNITKQPGFLGRGRIADSLPKSDIVMNNTFWIGCHPGITEEMMDYMIKTIKDFIDEKTKN